MTLVIVVVLSHEGHPMGAEGKPSQVLVYFLKGSLPWPRPYM